MSLSLTLQATLSLPQMSPHQAQWPARPARALRRSRGQPQARIGALGMTGYTYSPQASAEKRRQVSSQLTTLAEVGKPLRTQAYAYALHSLQCMSLHRETDAESNASRRGILCVESCGTLQIVRWHLQEHMLRTQQGALSSGLTAAAPARQHCLPRTPRPWRPCCSSSCAIRPMQGGAGAL